MYCDQTVLSNQRGTGSRSVVLVQILTAVVLVNLFTFTFWRFWAGSSMEVVDLVTSETGILEVLQALLLTLSAALCFYAAASVVPQNGIGSAINCGLGLIFIMLLLRELEIDSFGSSKYWTLLENILRGSVVLAAAVYGICIAPKIPEILRNWRSLLRSPALCLLALGVVFYVAGWPFDKRVFAISEGLALLLEEMLELNACMAFCYGANWAGSGVDAINAV